MKRFVIFAAILVLSSICWAQGDMVGSPWGGAYGDVLAINSGTALSGTWTCLTTSLTCTEDSGGAAGDATTELDDGDTIYICGDRYYINGEPADISTIVVDPHRTAAGALRAGLDRACSNYTAYKVNTGIDATARFVLDGSGTASALKLSTIAIGLVAVNGAGASANPFDYTGTLGNMNGSDDFTLFDVNVTNGTHSSTGNTIQVLDVAAITGSGNATETAIKIGAGWDNGIESASLATFSLGLTASGAALNLNASSNYAVNIATGTSTGAVTIGSTTTSQAITVQSGTGDVTVTSTDDASITVTDDLSMNGGSAGSILNLGTNVDGNVINVGTNDTAADTINIGSAKDTTAVAGIAVSVGSTGTTSALTLQSGTGDVTVTSTDDGSVTVTDDLTLNGGSAGSIINLGTNTHGNAINVGSDDTTADTIIIGSAKDTSSLAGISVTVGSTGTTSALVLQSGTGDIAMTSVDDVTINGGSAGSIINIGTNTQGNVFNIGTNDTTADTINIGSAKDTTNVAGILSATTAVVIPSGAAPAATCTVGQIFIDTDEATDTNCNTTADNSLCICTATNTWTALENN